MLGMTCALSCVAVSARPISTPSVAVRFQTELTPYGSWVTVAQLGRVWRPYVQVVGGDFVPYLTHGAWAQSSQGWVFQSDLPFGWAVYHYGRWYDDPRLGWLWVPGDEWGPSWVEWRSSPEFVGWMPLPPPRIEVVVGSYRPRWSFVETRYFNRPDIWRYRLDQRMEQRAWHEAGPARPDPRYISRVAGDVRRVDATPRPPRSAMVAPPPPPTLGHSRGHFDEGRAAQVPPPPPPSGERRGPPAPMPGDGAFDRRPRFEQRVQVPAQNRVNAPPPPQRRESAGERRQGPPPHPSKARGERGR